MTFCRRLGFLWLFLLVGNLRSSILVNARSHSSWHLGRNRNDNGRFGVCPPSLAPTADPPAAPKHIKKSKKKRKTEISDQQQPHARGTKSGKKVKHHKKTSQRPEQNPSVVQEKVPSQDMFHHAMPKSHKRIKRSKRHADGDQQRQYLSSKRELKPPPPSQPEPQMTLDYSGKRKHKQSKKGKKLRSESPDSHVDTPPQVNEIKSSEKKIKRTKARPKKSSLSHVMDETKPTFISSNDHTLAPTKRDECAQDHEDLHVPFESSDNPTSIILVGSSDVTSIPPNTTTSLEVDGTDKQAIVTQDGHAMTMTDYGSIDKNQADPSTALDNPSVESISPSPLRDNEPLNNETFGYQIVSSAHTDIHGADVAASDVDADIDADDDHDDHDHVVVVDAAPPVDVNAHVVVDAPVDAAASDDVDADADADVVADAPPPADAHIVVDVDTDIHADRVSAAAINEKDPCPSNHSSVVEAVPNVLDAPKGDGLSTTTDSISTSTDSDQDDREGGASKSDDWEGEPGEGHNESLEEVALPPTWTSQDDAPDHPLTHHTNNEEDLHDSTVNDGISIDDGTSATTSEATIKPSPHDGVRNEDEKEGQNDTSLSIDPQDPYLEPDVVQFIGQILKEEVEEVRGWTNDESTSGAESGSLTTSVNETRGGSQVLGDSHDDSNVIDMSSQVETDRSSPNTKMNTTKDPESSSVNEQENESTVEGIIESSSSASVGVRTVLDRSSLEVSEDKDTDAVVSIVTWNLAEESPSEDDALFIRSFRGSDLVLISGQECENIKPRRSEGRRSREYRRLMITMLGKEYVPIALHLLGGIQFGLFAKKSFLKQIEHVSVADVTCGIGNVFHNKGAIAAFLQIKARNSANEEQDTIARSKSVRMMFITAHMAAHVKNSDARDADFWRISSELEAQAPENFLLAQRSDATLQDRSFLFDSVDRVFFCGDLNYRIDLPREVVEGTILTLDEEMVCGDLLKHDQLLRTMTEGRAFPGFAEGKIRFNPTFKFDKETGEYDTSHKQRIPAWTDRILFKPWGTRVIAYDSVPGAQHSDHRPVYATFRVNLEGRELPPKVKRRREGGKEHRSKVRRADMKSNSK